MKEIKITPPEGYEIDTKNSTFDCIKFKPITQKYLDTIENIYKNKEEYWYIERSSTACFTTCYSLNAKGSARAAIYKIPSQQLANYLNKKFTLIQEMETFAYIRNEEWIPVWGSNSTVKWGIVADLELKIQDKFSLNVFVFNITVKSKEIAEEMLTIFGERIKGILRMGSNYNYKD